MKRIYYDSVLWLIRVRRTISFHCCVNNAVFQWEKNEKLSWKTKYRNYYWKYLLVSVVYNEPMRCTTVSVKTSKNLHTLHVELYQSLVLFVYIPISSLYLPGSRSWLDAKLHCARTSPACHWHSMAWFKALAFVFLRKTLIWISHSRVNAEDF